MNKHVIAVVLSLVLGASLSGQAVAGDVNDASGSGTPARDTTPPVITAKVTGTQGSNGWYTSNVSVAWTVSDAESNITSTSGCGTLSLTADTSGMIYTCKATSYVSHGRTSSRSPMAMIKMTKTLNVGDSVTKTFGADERVICWSCHNGPNP